MRIGRLHNIGRNEYVSLEDAYPLIMEQFNENLGAADVLSFLEDGRGEYIAHLNVCGINVLYRRDEQGFESLQTMSDDELTELQKRIDADYDASLDADSWDWDEEAAEAETMREARRIVGLE